MHRFALIVLVAAAGCKKSKETQCEELAKLGVAFANEMGKQLGGKANAGSDPEIQQKMAELKQQCMTWPDEVFECMRANDETSPKCVAAMQHVTGLVPADVTKAPSGPPVVGSAALGEVTWDGLPVHLAADGTLIAGPKDAIVAVGPDGTERWRAALVHDHWLLVDGGVVLAGDRDKHALVALVDGVEKWRVEIPAVDEYGERATEGAVKVGGKLYVAIADGRFLRVDPAACAQPKQKGCLEPAFALAGESLDTPQLAALGDDIVIAESNALRRVSTAGKVLGYVHVRDDMGGIAVGPGERIAAVMDDELVLFDFAQCRGSAPIELRRKQGRMYMRGEGECEGACVPPPAGCLIARAELSDVDSLAPTVLKDGSVMVSNFDGPARAALDGKKQWAAEIDSVGPIREAGDTIVFVSRGDDAAAARVVALDTQTGKPKWSTPLPGTKSDDISSTSDVLVEVAGPWLVAIAKGHASWIKAR